MNHEDVTDAYVARTHRLLRVAEGEAVDVSRRLAKIRHAIIREIRRAYGESVGDVPSKPVFLRMLRDIRKHMEKFYTSDWPDEMLEMEAEVIAKELEWNREFISGATGGVVVSGRSEAITRAARSRTYRGHTFDFHVKKAYRKDADVVMRTMTTGYNAGKSVGDMVLDVGNVLNRVDANVRTVTRSFYMHNAVEARNSVFTKNPDLIESIIWVSTLDSRTTPLICGVRDGLEYTLDFEPIGHSLPWDGGPGRIHWNCRSVSIPKLVGIPPATVDRAAVGPGPEYSRGDNKTRTGRVRKPNKDARERGIYKIEQRTSRSKYEGWFRAQAKKNLDYAADVLGSKERAKAFRDGQVTLSQLGAESPVANPLQRGLL